MLKKAVRFVALLPILAVCLGSVFNLSGLTQKTLSQINTEFQNNNTEIESKISKLWSEPYTPDFDEKLIALQQSQVKSENDFEKLKLTNPVLLIGSTSKIAVDLPQNITDAINQTDELNRFFLIIPLVVGSAIYLLMIIGGVVYLYTLN
jgi:hypothetical protein